MNVRGNVKEELQDVTILKNDYGGIIMSNDIEIIEEYIEIYGEDVTLGELLESFKLHNELN